MDQVTGIAKVLSMYLPIGGSFFNPVASLPSKDKLGQAILSVQGDRQSIDLCG